MHLSCTYYTMICFFCHMIKEQWICAVEVPIIIRICKLKPLPNALFTASTVESGNNAKLSVFRNKSCSWAGVRMPNKCATTYRFIAKLTTANPIAPPIVLNWRTDPIATAILISHDQFWEGVSNICLFFQPWKGPWQLGLLSYSPLRLQPLLRIRIVHDWYALWWERS